MLREVQVVRLGQRGDLHELGHATADLRIRIEDRGTIMLDQGAEPATRVFILTGGAGDAGGLCQLAMAVAIVVRDRIGGVLAATQIRCQFAPGVDPTSFYCCRVRSQNGDGSRFTALSLFGSPWASSRLACKRGLIRVDAGHYRRDLRLVAEPCPAAPHATLPLTTRSFPRPACGSSG